MNIKKFESFNLRNPTQINRDEANQKMEFHNPIPFSKEEVDFFLNLESENKGAIYEIDFWPEGWKVKGSSKIHISLYDITNKNSKKEYYDEQIDDGLIHIQISKISDDWYIIDETGIDIFLCDEFEEVKGYIGTQTSLKF